MKVPKDLDAIADAVLRYKPPAKEGDETARKTESQTCSKETVTVLMYIIPYSRAWGIAREALAEATK